MAKKDKINRYRWQPELAVSIIYWSITFSALFLSIISILEVNGLNVLFLLFLVLFLVLAYAGQRRHFQLIDDSLLIVTILKKNHQRIPLKTIDKIAIGSYGIMISGKNLPILKEEETSFLMTRKTQAAFLQALKQTAGFSGEIVSIKKSVG